MRLSEFKNVKAIFFDFDDTLFPTTMFAKKARAKGIKKILELGLIKNIDEDKAIKMIEETVDEFTPNYHVVFYNFLNRAECEGYANLKPMERHLCASAGTCEYQDELYKYMKMEASSDIYEVFAKLQERGYKLGIITDGPNWMQTYKIYRLKIYKYLETDYMFVSNMMGITKKNPKIFRMACKKAGLKPKECAYVGDNPEMDIAPAKKAGLIAIHMHMEGGKFVNMPYSIKPNAKIYKLRELLEIFQET